jgi:hypothetical protein
MQIVPAWPPVTCNMNKINGNFHATGGHLGTICMQLVATRVQFACDWRPLGYNLHVIGGHLGTICMRLAATRLQDKRQVDQELCKMLPLHQKLIFKMRWYFG